MTRVNVNNLGLIPLAGVCSYEDACKAGYDIDHNVNLLRRYLYAESQLNQIFAAHITSVPEWEVKGAFGLHIWLDAEHSAALRKRVTEMREPPLHLDKVPDAKIEAFFNEVIRAESTLELLVGIYRVAKPELVRSMKKHVAETNPLVDHPTCRVLKLILVEEEEMIPWGEAAVQALIRSDEDQHAAMKWQNHLESFLYAAGGISGDLVKPEDWQPAVPRANGQRYEMKVEPRRDARFVDTYNSTNNYDKIFSDESFPVDERTYALLYKRLREMDVPEWMGPIIYKTQGKPWEYYQDLSRQLWDEARHSMMGEVGLFQDGVEFYKYPVEFLTTMALNNTATPLEAHLVLWYIEQGLMPKDTGKHFEWVIAKASDNDLAKTFQDYDWADEVLHAQIGRKWLVPEYKNMEELKQQAEIVMNRNLAEKVRLSHQSDQKEWWPEFLVEIRAGRERTRGGVTV
ncbi:hypothetical protein GC102_23780 [Paenibacillus sp. LMG 31460]|uniref:DUF455 family protein n=1 Tax=Paenibacillus germinis TaxID=2654979 RepID=A0ABX1ZA21_9BACL|nr:hypothetical protein [Paenibacillus germinis]NOU88748.1 hypothetical protein [Paenibacillus germinis]